MAGGGAVQFEIAGAGENSGDATRGPGVGHHSGPGGGHGERAADGVVSEADGAEVAGWIGGTDARDGEVVAIGAVGGGEGRLAAGVDRDRAEAQGQHGGDVDLAAIDDGAAGVGVGLIEGVDGTGSVFDDGQRRAYVVVGDQHANRLILRPGGGVGGFEIKRQRPGRRSQGAGVLNPKILGRHSGGHGDGSGNHVEGGILLDMQVAVNGDRVHLGHRAGTETHDVAIGVDEVHARPVYRIEIRVAAGVGVGALEGGAIAAESLGATVGVGETGIANPGRVADGTGEGSGGGAVGTEDANRRPHLQGLGESHIEIAVHQPATIEDHHGVGVAESALDGDHATLDGGAAGPETGAGKVSGTGDAATGWGGVAIGKDHQFAAASGCSGKGRGGTVFNGRGVQGGNARRQGDATVGMEGDGSHGIGCQFQGAAREGKLVGHRRGGCGAKGGIRANHQGSAREGGLAGEGVGAHEGERARAGLFQPAKTADLVAGAGSEGVIAAGGVGESRRQRADDPRDTYRTGPRVAKDHGIAGVERFIAFRPVQVGGVRGPDGGYRGVPRAGLGGGGEREGARGSGGKCAAGSGSG